MSNVQKYILTIKNDKEKAKVFAADTAKGTVYSILMALRKPSDHRADLESKHSTLIDVVKSLGEYINDEDSTIRSRAVEYLSDVVGALPPDFLTRQQTQVLCQFLCDRIEDGGAVTGLKQLQANDRYSKEMAGMTFRA